MAIAVEVNFNGHGATLENYLKGLKIPGAAPREAPTPIRTVCFTG